MLKWGTLGSNRLKCSGSRWAPNLLKSVAFAPGVLKHVEVWTGPRHLTKLKYIK